MWLFFKFLFVYLLQNQTPNFDITDLSEYEVYMDVNLSLRLQRRVACDQSFNISCLLGRIQYDVGYLTIKDECFIEGKSVWNNTYVSILQKYYICIFLLTRAKLSNAFIYFMSCRTPKVILMFVKLLCIFYRARGNIDKHLFLLAINSY